MIIKLYNLSIIIIFLFSLSSNKYTTIYTYINIAFLWRSEKKTLFYLIGDWGEKTKRLINKKSSNLIKTKEKNQVNYFKK